MIKNLKIFLILLVALLPLNSWSQTIDEVREISYPFGDTYTTSTGTPNFETINVAPVTSATMAIDPDGPSGPGPSFNCDSGLTTSTNQSSIGISSNLMSCIYGLIDSVALGFMERISDNITNTLSAILMIGLVIYIVRIIFGAQQAAAGPTMLFTFKYIFVIFLATNPVTLNDFRQDFFNSSVGLGYVMTEQILGDPTNRCNTAVFDASAGQFRIFEYFDCIILDFVGYRIGLPASCTNDSGAAQTSPPFAGVGEAYYPVWPNLNCNGGDTVVNAAEPSEFKLVGLSMLLAGLFFTGPIGAAITVLVISLIMSILLALVQSMMLYVVSLFAVTVLFALAPVMAPFLLFEQTKSIFRQWWQHIIVYSLQPVILVAFLAVTLSVLADISGLMQDFYTNADLQQSGTNEKNVCTLFKFSDIISYDQSTWDPADVTAYNDAIADAKAGGGGVTGSSGFWNSIQSGITGAIDAVTGAVVNTVTKVSRAVTDFLLMEMGIDAFEVFCLKWHSGQLSLLFANLFAGFLLLLLTISFIRRVPDLIDKLVAPGIVSSIAQFASTDVSRLGNAAMGAAAARSSLGKSANSTVRR